MQNMPELTAFYILLSKHQNVDSISLYKISLMFILRKKKKKIGYFPNSSFEISFEMPCVTHDFEVQFLNVL